MFIPWWAILIGLFILIWFLSDRKETDHNRIDALQERVDVLDSKLDQLLDDLEEERWQDFDEANK